MLFRVRLQEKVKWFRKAFGGGIRQCGSLSVSANYCVDNHFPKLKATHELTSYLAKALAELGAQLLLPVGAFEPIRSCSFALHRPLCFCADL
jgi:threonine aldolase